jgi:hypothetical protein
VKLCLGFVKSISLEIQSTNGPCHLVDAAAIGSANRSTRRFCSPAEQRVMRGLWAMLLMLSLLMAVC